MPLPPGKLPFNPNVTRTVVLTVFWVAVVLVFLCTGIYTIPAESVGVVQRFGAFLTIVEPGLQFKIPYGVDVVTIVPIRRQLKMARPSAIW